MSSPTRLDVRELLAQLEWLSRGPPDVFQSGPSQVLDDSGAMTSFFDVEGGSGVSGLLPPGDVRVRIESGTAAVQVIEGTVVDGETLELQASLRPGTSRTVHMRTANGSPFPSASTLLVFDGAGDLVLNLQGFGYGSRDSAETRLMVAGLELGTYRFVLETSDGRSAEAEVSVATLERIEGDAATIVIE